MNIENHKDFKINDGVLIEYTGAAAHVVIPEGVTTISEEFKGIETIEIPISVTNISDDAFYITDTLSRVYYAGTIEDWCHIKFGNAWSNPMIEDREIFMLNHNNEYYLVENLDVIIPDTVVDTSYIFCGFTGLRSVTCPDTLTSIGHCTFSFSDVKYVHIGNGVREIEEEAFKGCQCLMHIEIGPNVDTIGDGAFARCKNLNVVCMNDKISSMSYSAFYSCNYIERVFVPKNMTNISYWSIVSSRAKIFYEGSMSDLSSKDKELDVMYNCTREMFDEYGNV